VNRLALYALTLTVVVFGMGATRAPRQLARVNGEAITEADLKDAFVSKHGGHTVFLGGDVETRRFLDVVINERLLIQEAYNLGLDADPQVKPKVDAFREQKSAEHLLKIEVTQKSEPAEEQVRASWDEALHLYLAREIVADTEREAEALRTSLLAGTDFEVLARSCSIAPTRTRGGALAPFTWGSQDLVIEQTVKRLEPGELSGVVHTSAGWTILQLIDRVEATRPPLDRKVSERIVAKLRERNAAVATDALSVMLWQKYEAAIVAEDRSAAGLLRLLDTATDTVVARWKGGTLTLRDALRPEELRMFLTFSPGRAADKIDSILRAAVNTSLIRLEAKERAIAEVPEVARLVDAYEARLMESALYAQHVLTGMKVEDAEVRTAYEAQKATLVIGEKRRVAHIALATEKEAKEVRARIDRGEDFFDLLAKVSLDTATLTTAGDLGWVEKGKLDLKYDSLFTLPKGGVSEPIAGEKGWHLVCVTDIAPERPLPFDEVKEKLSVKVLEKKKHDAREYWIAKLRKAGRVEILEPAVKAFVAANPYKNPER